MDDGQFNQLTRAIADLAEATGAGFSRIDKRLDDHGVRFDGIDRRLDGIDRRLDRHDERFESLETEVRDGFRGVNVRLDKLERDRGRR